MEYGQWKEIQETLGASLSSLSETFLRLKENCHGPLSFIEQNEENTTNNALDTLETPRIEPKQTEYPANHSYTDSIANFGDFDDFDETHSYINDDAFSHYSTASGPTHHPPLQPSLSRKRMPKSTNSLFSPTSKKKKSQH